LYTVEHLIAGKPTSSERRGPIFNPATGQQQGEVVLADAANVDHAVNVARDAFMSWRMSSLAQRAEILFSFRALLHARRGELARLVSSEHGKIVDDAGGEVSRGLDNVDFACGLQHLLRGSSSRQVSRGIDVHEVLEPLGVVVGITPFNFPVMVPLWMIPNALACGNTFILKPSEKDPSPSLMIASMLEEAGLPEGVLNVLHGDAVAVDALLAHRDVAAVSFVGSTPIARRVYEVGTRHGKRVQALGGAKNHMVVLPDADLDIAADAAVSAGFGSAGERCMAVSVVVAVGDVGDRLVPEITRRMAELRVGPGDHPDSQMGPLVTEQHRDRVANYLRLGRDEGAEIVVDGRETEFSGDGFFLGPSLIDQVRPEMAVYRDEIFGPVLSIVRVRSYEEALQLVNSSPYGNGVAIFTGDGAMARRFEVDVEVGMVGVNVAIPVPVAQYSFGGWKDSLFGDAHMYGPDGVRFYTRQKVVTTRWPERASSRVDLGFPAQGR
jgi:malonate-semialdehyde dehydrogenase (acetylating)/methylmalonate-semialdehyde dehydrogenase